MSSAQKIIQAAAGNAAGEATYVEDVFSTYLYEGNGSTQTITNGIDLDGEGGMLWIKNRGTTDQHEIHDSEQGNLNYHLNPSTTSGRFFSGGINMAFNSDGFSVDNNYTTYNASSNNYASWTFRKAPKFFDVVTYTGDGVDGREIAHNLGSAPGCVIVKRTDDSARWATWHRSLTSGSMLILELTNAELAISGSSGGGVSNADSSTFTVSTGSSLSWVNASGGTYVAYLFAHNDGDGEFGEDADQDIIKCGSYTGTGSAGLEVDLGFEPQWILWKNASQTSDWHLYDNMRSMTATSTDQPRLKANTSGAEANYAKYPLTTSTGFIVDEAGAPVNSSGDTHIYIAIRRGPMKTPEDATEVFAPVAYSGNGVSGRVISGFDFPNDLAITKSRSNTNNHFAIDRLRGADSDSMGLLNTNTTNAEAYDQTNRFISMDYMDGFEVGSDSDANESGRTYVSWGFRRAPGFFDVVAYEGTGSGMTVAHNLGVVPELMINKQRNASDYGWFVYHKDVGATGALVLNTNVSTVTGQTFWNNTAPTATQFTLGALTGDNGDTYIQYLFATLPGVSKVGSYTGTGASDQVIDCGFSTGARFVMLKRTDGTSNWRVWDTERGIVVGNDSSLDLDDTSAEATGFDQIDPDSSGFKLKANDFWNTSGAEFIFLAIA